MVSLAASDVTSITKAAETAGLTVSATGTVRGSSLTINGSAPISIAELTDLNEHWLPGFMGAE